MTRELSRRQFVCRVVPASSVAALGMSLEERILEARASAPGPAVQDARDPLPKGKIGNLSVSRIIIGGNLIAGFAHSRDLMYVSALMKRYFTDEKVFETLRIAEANGINTINTNPKCSHLIERYWKERGGKIQWIVQGYPDEEGKHLDEIAKCIDMGAGAIYIQGNIADRLVRKGRLDTIGKVLEFIRKKGCPAGVGGHSLEVPRACEKNRLPVDFYVKTLHSHDYFTAMRPEQKGVWVVDDRADNFWCANPAETIEFMKTVEKPWVAYKVLAAGAIHPKQAFPYVFNGGADFAVVGIFDFQIHQDVSIAKGALEKVRRDRPWRS